MSYLQDREDPKVFEAKWNAAMAEASRADSQAAFAREFNATMVDPEVVEERDLERAVAAYEALDEMLAPGGIAANLPASEKLRLQTATYKDVGPRPEFLSPAEIAENERAAAVAESARMRADLEAFNLAQVQAKGFNSVEDWRNGVVAPQPYLADRGVGEPRAYVVPNSDGRTVDEWIVGPSGRPVMNPAFARITEHLERLQKAKR